MAKKRIGIVSNDNGWGLSKDIQIIQSIFNNKYFYSEYVHYDVQGQPVRYDLQIHNEFVGGKRLGYSKYNVLVPNPEWLLPDPKNPKFWFHQTPRRHRFNATLCKTKHAVNIFKNMGMRNVVYVGFTTQDIYKPIKKIPEFLHIAGDSRFKNTNKVIEMWHEYKDLPKLHLFNSYQDLSKKIKTDNIVYTFGRQSAEVIRNAQNKYLYHIQPSMSEGFGHILWEALSCQSVLITLDAPPMNEVFSIKIPNAKVVGKQAYGTLYSFDIQDGYEAIKDLNSKNSLQGRQMFLANDVQFRKRFYNTIKDIIHGK